MTSPTRVSGFRNMTSFFLMALYFTWPKHFHRFIFELNAQKKDHEDCAIKYISL